MNTQENKTVDILFHSASSEQLEYKEQAYKNSWLSCLNFDVLSGRYEEVDANKHDYETKQEARNKAFVLAEKKLLGYLTLLDPKNTIALAVSKFFGVDKNDVIVYEKDLQVCSILGKPAYSFAAEYAAGQVIRGEFLIGNTLARFVFEDKE